MFYSGEEKPLVSRIEDRMSIGFGIELPNGLYRFTIKLSSEADPFIYCVQWQTEIRERLNDERF
jgi:hypothetical protein